MDRTLKCSSFSGNEKDIEKNRMLFCFFWTIVFGLLAHSYRFFRSAFSHDSLDSIFSDSIEYQWKIGLGRFFAPLVLKLRGNIALPWLVGIVSIIFVAIAVWLVIKTLDIKSKATMILVSGIMVTNITVTATAATYIHDFDFDMLALLFSCAAAYIMMKKQKLGWYILSSALIMLSLGLYQSYIEVALMIVIIASVKNLLDGFEAKDVVKCGLKSIVSFVCGGVAYFALYKIICKFMGVAAQERTELHADGSTSIIVNIKTMFYKVLSTFIKPVSAFSSRVVGILNVILIAIGVILCLLLIFKLGRNKTAEKIVALLLLASMPIAINIISIAVNGVVYELMIYSFWFMYIFSLLMTDEAEKIFEHNKFSKYIRIASIVIIGVIIWNNIVVANTAYLKKDLENTATVSAMTRVVDDLEERDDYSVGKTEISFVGSVSTMKTMPGFEFLSDTTGLRGNGSISQSGISDHYNLYKAFFNYYLNYPINYSSKDFSDNEKVKNMPTYPEKGYIQNIDGVLVVKMG